jgi:electron transfer flavoprotein alpha/beta subunit
VITVAPKAYRPRYAPGARIMNAYREWDVPVWGLADLGLNAEDLKPRLVFRSETFPPPLEVGEKFRGDPAETAQDVVVALRLQKLIA